MFIADFHIHSQYSRATSRECVPEVLEMWARRKGIDVLGTGDFTHPAWRQELKEKLVPAGEGLYALKNDFRREDEIAGSDFKPRFIISGEISSIYKKSGRVRKVHNLILLPGLEQAGAIARRLEAVGNIHSDGRPILGLDSRDLLEIVLECCPQAIFIPAHIWTPHFSLYGAYSGFDDIRECYEDLTPYIHALETGLSSDPSMNWRLSALDEYTLVSNSDAHSPANLAREANIFETGLSYPDIRQALKNRNTNEFHGTIEFFPEEGKYHYDGHRACKVCWKPAETKAAAGICPVCGGRITVGVLHRVEALADREEGFVPPAARHFESLAPLQEVIASSLGCTVASKKSRESYQELIRELGPELHILRQAPLQDIELTAGPCIAEGIRRLRCGQVEIRPGFDGEYGKIKILDKSEIDRLSGQLCFFGEKKAKKAAGGSKPEAAPEAAVQGLTNPRPSGKGEDSQPTADPEMRYGLNGEQWEAVSATDQTIAVIAGPGTGKTKTLVYRIVYLVEECGVSPAQITAVTFTNKAAREMRSRLEKHFGNKGTVKDMHIGTFHSLCLQILSGGKGKSTVSLIDEYNALSLIEEIVKDNKLKLAPRDIRREMSLLKSGATSIKDGSLPVGDQQLEEAFSKIYDLYCAQLEHYGVMDYDDILREVLKKFVGANLDDSVEKSWESAFTHLLVDEFQDINEIQYHLIKAWSRKSKSVFIIGDPDQSIYGFRGSDFRFFAKFKEDFSGLRQVCLTQNYRSTSEILVCAQTVLTRDKAGSPVGSPGRFLEAKRGNGARVRLVETGDEFAEALFVAKEINRMVGGMDMLDAQGPTRSAQRQASGFSDIALLYRTNRQAEILEQCLGKEGIPYRVAGREDFLAEKPVREAIAFFSFLLNPKDLISLRVCLQTENSYPPDLKQKILGDYAAAGKSVSSLAGIMENVQPLPRFQDKPLHFTDMLKKYGPVVHKEKPWKMIEAWIIDNNLSDFRCLELLRNTALLQDRMSSLLQTLLLGRESDVVRSGSKSYSADAVSLMTLHAAKGLEFPIVFLCGVNDGLIPLRSKGPDLDLDEEKRLFYVGMTRACNELVLLSSRTPSPFLADLPEEHLEKGDTPTRKTALWYRQASLF